MAAPAWDQASRERSVGEELELRQYAALLWHWLWLIVLCTILAAGSAFFVSSRMEPVYEASTTLLVSQATSRSLTTDYQAIMTNERLGQTYSEMMRKRPVMERVVEELGLAMPAEALAGMVSVQMVRDTQLMNLSVQHTDPALAMAVAYAVPLVFADFNAEMQAERFAKVKGSLSSQMQNLQEQITEAQSLVGGLSTSTEAGDQAERIRLQLWLTQLQGSHASLQRSYEDIRLAEASSMDTVTVVEPAVMPGGPIRPSPMRDALLAAVVGAMLGMGVAFLIEYLDDTIKHAGDVDQALGLTTLGTITRFGGESLEDKLVTSQHSRSNVTEAYRILRTNLEFASVDESLRTVVVTSASPREGKSVTAANLAVVMAQSGRTVVLVDSDLRRPSLHRIFGVSNEVGLTSALLHSGNPGAQEMLQQTEIENLRVLPSGPLPPNPAELLGSVRMSSLVEQLKSQADILVFDSPPALPVTDPAVLAQHVDAVLLVVEAGTARRGAVLRAAEGLTKVGANLAGVVLNKLSRRSGGYYHYYYDRYSQYYSSDGHDDGEPASKGPRLMRWWPLGLQKRRRGKRRRKTATAESEEAGSVIEVRESQGRDTGS